MVVLIWFIFISIDDGDLVVGPKVHCMEQVPV
jgi:hypothetical protein